MKKFTDFLEKNSQWLAMALGGFWLLFMVYSHILASSTASVDVKGNALGPGSVDQFIEDNAIAKLKDAMANMMSTTMDLSNTAVQRLGAVNPS